MGRSFTVTPHLSPTEAVVIIAALRASQQHTLAEKIGRAKDMAERQFNEEEQEAVAVAAARADRARNHTLTRRQAVCLASVRAGHGPYYDLQKRWGDAVEWVRSRSIGGAVTRMVNALIDEGVLTDRRALTPEGAERLAHYEAEWGRLGSTADLRQPAQAAS